MHVALGYELFSAFEVDVFKASRKVNASTLTHIYWFYDESLSFFLVELSFKIVLVRWQDPSLRKEIEFILKGLLHAC